MLLNIFVMAFKIVFLLGFLIFIHEGGHFLVAKLCKIKVLEFAIGFGPTIWSKQGKETKYAIRLIPLGGFVNLEGEEKHSDDERSFSNASIPKRMAIIIAGATVNIVFGIVVYFILMTATSTNISNIVEKTIPGYSAEEVGLLPEDTLVRINDRKVKTKNDISTIVDNSNGEELEVTILREGQEKNIKIKPTPIEYKSIGIYFKANDDKLSTKIVGVDKDSNAEKTGLKANDKIIKINDVDVNSQDEIIDFIQNDDISDELVFTIKRGNEEKQISVIPDKMYAYYLGIQFKLADNSIGSRLYYAIFETRDFLTSIFSGIKQLFTGRVGLNQMMGPVGISEAVATTKSTGDFFYLMALISVSLGITNLLPFPALDGGKFVLILFEAITRKKVSEEFEIKLQLLGFTLLIILAIFVTYNDILRIL